jgi:hypothetical protein
MPDYNLGRAHGEVIIDADTSGIQEAKAEMAAAAAEAEALDKSMGRVNKSFDDNRAKSTLTAEQLVNHRGRVEELRKTYERYNQDYQEAAKKREEADRKLRRASEDEETSGKRLLSLGRDLQRAKLEEERMLQRMTTAYDNYHQKLSLLRYEVERFNRAHIDMSRGFQNITREAERAGRSLEMMADKLARIVTIMGTTGIYGLFGGAAAGSLGLLGGAGLDGITVALGGLLEIVKDFSGAMLLIPGVVNGAVLSLGTLAVAFQGIGAALGSLENPAEFAKSLRDLAPAAQQAMLQIQQFTNVFRGARQQIQESLFEPILKDIRPLIETWLPELMHAGQAIANQFGQSFHQVFQFFQDPAVVEGFRTFTANLVQGFNAARGAIQPFLAAWNTLANVGSQVFERIGRAITTVAEEFNNWVNNAANSGQLLRLINGALDGFTALGRIIKELGIGLFNIFDIAESVGGSFLLTLNKLAVEFRAWTESASGKSALTEFFTLLHETAEKAGPVIKDLGRGIVIIVETMMKLGIAIQPGLVAFFDSLVKSLGQLGPSIEAMAPAINQFLVAFGQTLLQIVQQMGPQLPGLFKSLSDAFVELMKVVPPVANALSQLLSHITPGEIETIIGLFVAFKTLSTIVEGFGAAIAVLTNPVGLLIIGLALLAGGIYLLVTHLKSADEKVTTVKESFGNLGDVVDNLKRLWDRLTDTVSHFWNTVLNSIVGGWHTLLSSLGSLRDSIVNWWRGIDWAQLGKDIVQGIVHGLLDPLGLQSVADAMTGVMKETKKPTPRSRAETGPWSDMSPEEAGAKLSSDYALGIESGSGAVADASLGVANASTGGGRLTGGVGGAGGSGLGPGGFTSAGQAGISGQGMVGGSGFSQWLDFVTKDLSAWSSIAQHSFKLFQDISKVVVDGIKVAASLWNGGRNPLTIQGGIAGPQPSGLPQYESPEVPSVPVYGEPPLPNIVPPQQGQGQLPAGDVPQVAPGATLKPGDPGFIGPVPLPPKVTLPPGAAPPAAPPPPQQAAAAAAVVSPGGGLNERQADISNRIIAEGQKRKATPDQIRAALAIAADESNLGANDVFNTSGGNASVGGVGGIYQQAPAAGWGTREQVMDPNYSIPKFWDAFSKHPQYQSNPMVAAVLTQNPQIGPNPVGTDYYNAVQAAQQKPPYQAAAKGVVTAPALQSFDIPLAPPPGGPAPLPIPPIQDVSQTIGKGLATYGPRPSPADLFLVHTNAMGTGTPEDIISGQRAAGDFSYNYYVDVKTGRIVQGVPPGQEAISTGGVNQRSINATFAGAPEKEWSRDEWLKHPEAIRNMAYLAATSGVPLTNIEGNTRTTASGIGGHDWATRAGFQTAGHLDPGPNFPWDVLIPQAQQYRAQGVTAQNLAGNAPPAAPPPVQAPAAPPPGAPTPGQPAPIEPGKIPGAAVNPASVASQISLGGTSSTTEAFQLARQSGLEKNPPLVPPGSEIPYGDPNKQLPDWVFQLANRFGLQASTSTSASHGLHELGYAFDFAPAPGLTQEQGIANMDAFSTFLQDNLTPNLLELIHQNEHTGQQWRVAGGQKVGPGTAFPGYFDSAIGQHGDYGEGPHVHTAFDVPPILPGINAPAPEPVAPPQDIAPINPDDPNSPGGPGIDWNKLKDTVFPKGIKGALGDFARQNVPGYSSKYGPQIWGGAAATLGASIVVPTVYSKYTKLYNWWTEPNIKAYEAALFRNGGDQAAAIADMAKAPFTEEELLERVALGLDQGAAEARGIAPEKIQAARQSGLTPEGTEARGGRAPQSPEDVRRMRARLFPEGGGNVAGPGGNVPGSGGRGATPEPGFGAPRDAEARRFRPPIGAIEPPGPVYPPPRAGMPGGVIPPEQLALPYGDSAIPGEFTIDSETILGRVPPGFRASARVVEPIGPSILERTLPGLGRAAGVIGRGALTVLGWPLDIFMFAAGDAPGQRPGPPGFPVDELNARRSAVQRAQTSGVKIQPGDTEAWSEGRTDNIPDMVKQFYNAAPLGTTKWSVDHSGTVTEFNTQLQAYRNGQANNQIFDNPTTAAYIGSNVKNPIRTEPTLGNTGIVLPPQVAAKLPPAAVKPPNLTLQGPLGPIQYHETTPEEAFNRVPSPMDIIPKEAGPGEQQAPLRQIPRQAPPMATPGNLGELLGDPGPAHPVPQQPVAPAIPPGGGYPGRHAEPLPLPPITPRTTGPAAPVRTSPTGGPYVVDGVTHFPAGFVGPVPPGAVRDTTSTLSVPPAGQGQPIPVIEQKPDRFPGGPQAPRAPQQAPQQPPPSQGPHGPVQRQGDAGHAGTGAPPGPVEQPAPGAPGGPAQPLPKGPGGIGPQSTDTPLQQFETGMQGIATIVGDAFMIFDDILKNIEATGKIAETLAIGVHNTEDLVGIIQNIQTFIKTAADIAKTVGDVASTVNSFIPDTGGADFGGTAAAKAALGAVSAIAGVVTGALQAANEAISLGIEIYHEVGKYAGFVFGALLGGSLGTLGGNVRMILNTRTGQIYAYSEDNPLNKNTINTPFTRAYNQPPAIQNQNNQLNLYTGPGQSPMQMMQNTMWMVSTGAPQVASVAAGGD